MAITGGGTALAFTQTDFLSPATAAWELGGKRAESKWKVAHIERSLAAVKQAGILGLRERASFAATAAAQRPDLGDGYAAETNPFHRRCGPDDRAGVRRVAPPSVGAADSMELT